MFIYIKIHIIRKLKMKLKTLSLLIVATLSFNVFSAEDGIPNSSLSSGNISATVTVDPVISVTNLRDLNFTNVNLGTVTNSFSETLETDICVFTNAPSFTLSISPTDGYMSHTSYTQSSPEELRDNIPVTYSLFSNQYAEGFKSGEIELASNFTTDLNLNSQTPTPGIVSTDCLDVVSDNRLNNYTLKGTIDADAVRGVAAGDYFQVVYIRASIPII